MASIERSLARSVRLAPLFASGAAGQGGRQLPSRTIARSIPCCCTAVPSWLCPSHPAPSQCCIGSHRTRAGGYPRCGAVCGQRADYLRQRRLRDDHRLPTRGSDREKLPLPARQRPPAARDRHDARSSGDWGGDRGPASQLPQERSAVLERPPSRPGDRHHRPADPLYRPDPGCDRSRIGGSQARASEGPGPADRMPQPGRTRRPIIAPSRPRPGSAREGRHRPIP